MVIVIRIFFQILIVIVIVDAIVTFILPPYHSIRTFLDRIVEPMLNPIRRVIPSLGGLDLSPIVLILLLNLIEYLLVSLIQ